MFLPQERNSRIGQEAVFRKLNRADRNNRECLEIKHFVVISKHSLGHSYEKRILGLKDFIPKIDSTIAWEKPLTYQS